MIETNHPQTQVVAQRVGTLVVFSDLYLRTRTWERELFGCIIAQKRFMQGCACWIISKR